MYQVNGTKFDSFFAAIAAAKAAGTAVTEVSTGATRWSPAPKKAAKTVRYVTQADDGTYVYTNDFGLVRRKVA